MTYLLICLLIGCVIAAYLATEQLILWASKGGAKRDQRIAVVMAPDHGRPWSTERPLPGAAEGGSTYQHHEDDWFDERRPAHPDRPDEDY